MRQWYSTAGLPGAALVILLVLYAGIGLFTRIEADDYCVAGRVDARQFHHATLPGWTTAMYTGWSGRYSQLIVHGALAHLDPLANMLVPGLLIALSVWLLRRLTHLLTALALVAAFLLSMPDGDGFTFYWLSSSLTYVAPVVVMLAALVLLRQGTRFIAPVLFALGILAGGFSESTTLGIALVWLVLTGRRGLLFLVGLVIAFGIVYIAPGNAVRATYFPERDLTAAFYAAWDWWLSTASGYPVGIAGYALAFAVGLVYPARIGSGWRWGLLAALVTFGTMMAVTYGAGWSYRPERTLILPVMLWCVTWYSIGAALAGKRHIQGRGLLTVLVMVCMVVPLNRLPGMVAYSQAWDARDALIRSGVTTVPGIGARDTLTDMNNYANVCASAWYGVDEIVVKND